jgi:outer membrane protein assembly factor BamB
LTGGERLGIVHMRGYEVQGGLRLGCLVVPVDLARAALRTGWGERRMDMRTRSWRVVAAAIAAGLLVGGCDRPSDAAGDPPTAPSGKSQSQSPQRRTFDPPTRFDPAAAVRLPEELAVLTDGDAARRNPPAALYKTTLYVPTSKGLLRVDATTGQIVGTVTARRESWSSRSHRPLLAVLDGVPAVVVPFEVTVAGSGTTPSHQALEIHVVAAEDGKELSSVEAAIDVDNPSVMAVSDDLVLLNGDVDADGTVYGIDLATGKVRWKRDNFHVTVVEDGLAIGIAQLDNLGFVNKATAIRVADGGEQWSDAETSLDRLSVQSAGPGRLLILGTDGRDYRKGYYRMADIRTGAGNRQEASTTLDYACRFDEVSVTVCSGPLLFAMDAKTGDELWRLPDEKANRIAPSITAVWHGAIYGTTENGPLVLDARTGADREISAGVAPYLVNEYVGIALVGGTWDEVIAVPPVA